MRSVAKWVFGTIVAIVIVVVLAFSYALFGDLTRHQGRMESLLSEAAGYEIRIGDDFELDVGAFTTLSSNSLKVSNSSWDNDKEFASTGLLSISFETWSLYEPPIVIESLSIDGLSLRLVVNSDGQGNWQPAASDEEPVSATTTAAKIDVRQFNVHGIDLLYGETNVNIVGEVAGGLRVMLGAIPEVVLDVTATSLEWRTPLRTESEISQEAGLLFSGDTIDADVLRSFDATLKLHIDQLTSGETRVQDATLSLDLNDSSLQVLEFSFQGFGGEVSAEMSVVPVDKMIDINASLSLDELRFGSPWSDDADLDSLPATTASVTLTAVGSSLHELASAATGRVEVTQGPGRLKEIAATGLFGDVVVQVFQLLNPLSKEDPYTSLECAFYDVSVAEGLATIEDLRIQTDEMVIVGDGKVILADETVDMSIRAKPREGLGISLGGVANSFVKLGGTLAQPEIQFDAASGATTTGAAVATGGLSLLARGLWDRLSAANDICVTPDDNPINYDSDPEDK